jgi:hypothetical protein
MRLSAVQWKGPWPQRWSKWRLLWALEEQGANTRKCDLDFDWWEVEWPEAQP